MGAERNDRSKLVILGSGFGAVSLLRSIDLRLHDVTVVSRRNHFLFTPLLPSTTVGTIEFRSIIEPVRRPGIRFYQATCESIDAASRRVWCRQQEPFTLDYDRLVVAVGAAPNTYDVPGVAEHALFLKELDDARRIRQRVIECLELASLPNLDVAERARLLHFVICGGGPTGVEFAAELHDLLIDEGGRYFAGLLDQMRITLVEAGPEILTGFDRTLRSYATDLFRRQRIELRTGARVARVEKDSLNLADGEWIPFGLLLWSTGNAPADLVRGLPWQKEASGRILTDQYLRVLNLPEVYALGDCSATLGKTLPATSQVAMKQGSYLAAALNRLARGRPAPPFEYHHLGMLAYIGSHRALADLEHYKGKGWTTWLFWRSAYLTRLLSLRSKLQVLLDWLKSHIFGRDISRF